jgi:hypothetical protein
MDDHGQQRTAAVLLITILAWLLIVFSWWVCSCAPSNPTCSGKLPTQCRAAGSPRRAMLGQNSNTV